MALAIAAFLVAGFGEALVHGEMLELGLFIDKGGGGVSIDAAGARVFAPSGLDPLAIQYPSARALHHMVYASQSDRVILYSGVSTFSGVDINDMWTYEVAANAWTQLFPSTLPPAGLLPGPDGRLAYDSQSDRSILFQKGETWAYDLNANTWTNMTPPTAPPGPQVGRRGMGMAYDRESDRIILFGGEHGAPGFLYNDTWAYDFNTNTWIEMTPAIRPPSRLQPGMVYDAASDRIILFGGASADPSVRLGDTWAYDYNNDTWTRLNPTPSPSPRGSPGMVFDSDIHRSILFGGVGPDPPDRTNAETWTYEYSTNTWTQVTPSTFPSPRAWHAMVYAVASHRTVLFGGGPDRVSAFNQEAWIFDSATNTWTPMDTSSAPASALPPVLIAAAAGVAGVAFVVGLLVLRQRRKK